MDIEQRIAQFENMCREDANNDMAHFSLAGAYAQAGRHADAAASYVRCIELNPAMSKAYQLAGASYLALGDNDNGSEILTRGYIAASERGDMLPVKAMAEMLEKLGSPVPELETSAAPQGPAGSFLCTRTGKPGTKMPRPPFRGPLGEWIQENISRETFMDGWVPQGTKVINELRLDLSRDEDGLLYDQAMREYLGIDDDMFEQITGGKPPQVNRAF